MQAEPMQAEPGRASVCSMFCMSPHCDFDHASRGVSRVFRVIHVPFLCFRSRLGEQLHCPARFWPTADGHVVQTAAYTVLVRDSFFGSHATAQRLAREGRPFITMVRKDMAGVQQAGDTIQAGQTAVATVEGQKYALQVYKQPKTGGKPPKLVPILSNVWYAARGPLHHTALEIHPLVVAYRQVAREVDCANQMAL